jgi:hypothetical protein
MPAQFSLQVIHPAFELLKRSAGILHFIAASVIFINALYVLSDQNCNKIICYTQIIIAADIYLLVFFGGILLIEAPRLNLIFRFIETITLFGISVTLLTDGHNGYIWLYSIATAGYLFLVFREWRVLRSEAVDIKHTGISFPDFIKDKEISWNEIKFIIPKYHSISIETLQNKKIEFNFRTNLKIDELEQINDFCKKHLCNG